jgi:hypothetical protein
MYVSVVSVDDLPAHSPGSPLPVVFADDQELILAYETGEEVTILRFERPFAHTLGPPNDETLHGHPLAKYGLAPYGIFEVLRSPWVNEFERRNRVHPRHDRRKYDGLRHFVFTFHDSTFECLARGVRVAATLGMRGTATKC